VRPAPPRQVVARHKVGAPHRRKTPLRATDLLIALLFPYRLTIGRIPYGRNKWTDGHS
jgi:hypothetical protein